MVERRKQALVSEEKVEVSANAGLIDGIQATARYVVVLITFTTALFGLFQAHDIAAIFMYVKQNGGQALGAVSGLIALGTAAYGVFKTRKRSNELEKAAIDPANENVVFK